MAAGLISELLDHLLGRGWAADDDPAFLRWAPDAFAVASTVLDETGAYIKVVGDDWPPRGEGTASRSIKEWEARTRARGHEWRVTGAGDRRPPRDISALWQAIRQKADRAMSTCGDDFVLCHALLELLAAADEASAGAGVPGPVESGTDPFLDRVSMSFMSSLSPPFPPSTLCRTIDASKAIVLPKMRTPQSGITIRSLTHHLALVRGCGVKPVWMEHPAFDEGDSGGRGLNLLLIPFPDELAPLQFRALRTPAGDMPGAFGYFKYDPSATATDPLVHRLPAVLKAAQRLVGRIDGVALPEMALGPADLPLIITRLKEANPPVRFLVSGVYKAGRTDEEPAENYALMHFLATGVNLEQHKHHRWYLDDRQNCNDGLGSRLDPQRKWWEHIKLVERKVHFVALHDWLGFTVLICKDLARPDPIGDILRAVGPNLVIALLQDGPQLASRWSARSAAPLADDPGSAVPTLTSAGMAKLCRPPGKSPSRVVALWRDSASETTEIELPAGADGLVLCLTNRFQEQWAADGRGDGGSTGNIGLAGVHPVVAPKG